MEACTRMRTRDELEWLEYSVCPVLCVLAVWSTGSPRINYDPSVTAICNQECNTFAIYDSQPVCSDCKVSKGVHGGNVRLLWDCEVFSRRIRLEKLAKHVLVGRELNKTRTCLSADLRGITHGQ